MNTSAVIHVVDDDASVRTALKRVLKTAGYHVVIHESGAHFLQNIPELERGCIVLDVRMPGLSGPQLQDLLIDMKVEMPIIFLTGHGDFPTSVRAIKVGAEDFLTKPVSRKILLKTVARALKHYDEVHERNIQQSDYRKCFNSLTAREHEVLNLVVRGKLNKQIGYELGTSERTVKAHRHSIMQKFDVKSLAELVLIAERLGVLERAAS